jgi:PAS domain S-box-containing protein
VQDLIDTLPFLVCIRDNGGRYIACNRAYGEYFGVPPSRIPGLAPKDVLSPDSALRSRLEDQRVLRSGVPSESVEGISKDGRESWFKSQTTPYRDPAGRVCGVVVSLQDITSIRREAHDHYESGERFRSIVENISDGLVIHDLKGSILDVNEQICRITGFAREELLRLNLGRQGHEEESRGILERLAREGAVVFETQIHRRDGKAVHLSISTKLVSREGDGRAQAFVRDITALKTVEEAIRRTSDRFRNVVQASPMGIHMYRLDAEGRLVFTGANEAADRILGVDNSQFIGMTIEEAFPPLAGTEVPDRYRAACSRGEPWETKQITYEHDEIRGAFEVHAFPTSPGEMAVLFLDITERIRNEQQIGRLASAVDQVADGLMILDTQTRILYTNRAFERITGYSAKEVVGRVPAFLGPDEAGTARFFNETVIPRILRGETWRGAQPLRRKDGTLSISESVVSPVRDASGNLANLVSAIRDISEQMKQEQEIRLLAAAMEQLDEAVLITDAAQVIQYVNPAFERITGYSRHEAVGRTPAFLVPPETAPEIFRSMGEKVTAGENWTGRFLNVKKDGSLFTAEVSISTAHGPDGRPTHGISIMRDITHQIQAEEEMLRLATAFNQVGDGIMMLDMEGNIQFVNPAFERITGFRREEIQGRNSQNLLGDGDPAALGTLFGSIQGRIQAGQTSLARFTTRRKDRSVLVAEATISPVLDVAGRLINVIAVIHDVTDKTVLEERLQQSQKMEAIGQLAGGVAHDFNNLLAPILGYVQMLLLKLPPEDPCRADLQEIEKAAYRGRDLSRQLLTFSRKQVVEMRPVTLVEVLEGFQRILRRTIREDIVLQVFPSATERVMADPAQLELILMNLVLNAQDAMPNGGTIVIETQDTVLDEDFARRHPGTRPGPHVLLAVSDTGCGMDEEQRKHLFEPFYTTKAKEKGTGLGLATVYGIVRQHGAAILLYSEPGKGTTFRIYFPCARETDRPDPLPAPSPAPADTRGHETVIVVEDEEAVRNMVVSALERFGYTVIVARDPQEALKLSAEVRPLHLLLTDVVMPGMNGRDLHRAMRERLPGLRVVFMSGYTQNIIAHHGVLDPGIHLLQKPFTLETLAGKVREALDGPAR